MIYLSAIAIGLALSAMCLGIFISLRIFNFPDITTDGSYTTGAAITATGLIAGWPLPVILLLAMAGGAIAGMLTGLIHTGMRLNSLLSGILVMTGLYSVNLAIMGRSNIPLTQVSDSIFRWITFFGQSTFNELFALCGIILLAVLFLWWLLRTDFGLAMRATGNNFNMARNLGIRANAFKVTGLAIANAFTAISGFLMVQLQGFADINMGIGIVIIGLGAVMIGESLMNLLGLKAILWRLAGVLAGSIVFRMILTGALSAGIDPLWLKLLTAVLVILLVGLPNMLPGVKRRIQPD